MYFTYNNNTLGDSKRAYLYACIIAGKERDPQTYESYRESMEEFAFRKLREGRMKIMPLFIRNSCGNHRTAKKRR